MCLYLSWIVYHYIHSFTPIVHKRRTECINEDDSESPTNPGSVTCALHVLYSLGLIVKVKAFNYDFIICVKTIHLKLLSSG